MLAHNPASMKPPTEAEIATSFLDEWVREVAPREFKKTPAELAGAVGVRRMHRITRQRLVVDPETGDRWMETAPFFHFVMNCAKCRQENSGVRPMISLGRFCTRHAKESLSLITYTCTICGMDGIKKDEVESTRFAHAARCSKSPHHTGMFDQRWKWRAGEFFAAVGADGQEMRMSAAGEVLGVGGVGCGVGEDKAGMKRVSSSSCE